MLVCYHMWSLSLGLLVHVPLCIMPHIAVVFMMTGRVDYLLVQTALWPYAEVVINMVAGVHVCKKVYLIAEQAFISSTNCETACTCTYTYMYMYMYIYMH